MTFLKPELFMWVKGDVQTLVLGIIMLTMGMTLTMEDLKILLKRPRDIFIGACAQYTLMPLIAFLLVKVFGLPPAIAIGMLLVGCCPGGVSSNIITFLSKGDVALSVGMTTVSTLLAPVFTPLLMLFLADNRVDVDGGAMFCSMLLATLLPVVIGVCGNLFWGRKPFYQELCAIMPGVSVLAFACIVGGVISTNGAHFFHSGVLIFVGVFLHNALGYLTGYGVGLCLRMPFAKCRTLSIEVGVQNAGLATVLATKHFPLFPEAALAAAVSCVWHSISGTLLAGGFMLYDCWREKKHKAVL
ncbi:MAG: bile acid:sodium symporter family protein [bacterium]|nr:bile acid:sodium symporter family protein [bacterium]